MWNLFEKIKCTRFRVFQISHKGRRGFYITIFQNRNMKVILWKNFTESTNVSQVRKIFLNFVHVEVLKVDVKFYTIDYFLVSISVMSPWFVQIQHGSFDIQIDWEINIIVTKIQVPNTFALCTFLLRLKFCNYKPRKSSENMNTDVLRC